MRADRSTVDDREALNRTDERSTVERSFHRNRPPTIVPGTVGRRSVNKRQSVSSLSARRSPSTLTLSKAQAFTPSLSLSLSLLSAMLTIAPRYLKAKAMAHLPASLNENVILPVGAFDVCIVGRLQTLHAFSAPVDIVDEIACTLIKERAKRGLIGGGEEAFPDWFKFLQSTLLLPGKTMRYFYLSDDQHLNSVSRFQFMTIRLPCGAVVIRNIGGTNTTRCDWMDVTSDFKKDALSRSGPLLEGQTLRFASVKRVTKLLIDANLPRNDFSSAAPILAPSEVHLELVYKTDVSSACTILVDVLKRSDEMSLAQPQAAPRAPAAAAASASAAAAPVPLPVAAAASSSSATGVVHRTRSTTGVKRGRDESPAAAAESVGSDAKRQKTDPKVSAVMDGLECTICSHLIHQCSVLQCGHTFCRECIKRWFQVNPNHTCPVCRNPSASITGSLAIDSLIKKVVDVLSPEQKAERQAAIDAYSYSVRVMAERPARIERYRLVPGWNFILRTVVRVYEGGVRLLIEGEVRRIQASARSIALAAPTVVANAA